MSELTPEIVDEVVAACKEGAEEAAGALSRGLDGEFTLSVGESASYDPENAPEGFDGAGLAVLLKFGDVGLAAILPQSSELLPEWIEDPDPTGESKLSTLAQELSMLLVPETLMADVFEAASVSQIDAVLSAAQVAEDAATVPLEIKSGEKSGTLSLIWPLASPDKLFPEVATPEVEAEEEPAAEEAAAEVSTSSAGPPPPRPSTFAGLPPYSRSLLKVRVPVHVVLASHKESLKNVVELAAGTIIKFEKGCDEPLHLYVGNQRVAEGEAVKIGDKFGFRLSSMTMPDEHFQKAKPKSAG